MKGGKNLKADKLKKYSKGSKESPFWNVVAETMPRDELNNLHLKRLKKLVRYVYENSIFYRSRFKEIGLEPGDIKTLDDYKKGIPFTALGVMNSPSSFPDKQLTFCTLTLTLERQSTS